jgi:hypothetical protein
MPWKESSVMDERLRFETLQPLENPFGPKVLPMSQERTVTHVSGPDKFCDGSSNIPVSPDSLSLPN